MEKIFIVQILLTFNLLSAYNVPEEIRKIEKVIYQLHSDGELKRKTTGDIIKDLHDTLYFRKSNPLWENEKGYEDPWNKISKIIDKESPNSFTSILGNPNSVDYEVWRLKELVKTFNSVKGKEGYKKLEKTFKSRIEDTIDEYWEKFLNFIKRVPIEVEITKNINLADRLFKDGFGGSAKKYLNKAEKLLNKAKISEKDKGIYKEKVSTLDSNIRNDLFGNNIKRNDPSAPSDDHESTRDHNIDFAEKNVN